MTGVFGHLSLVACGHDHVVHPCAVCHSHPPCRRPSGDFLEPRANLLHRNQHGRDGKTTAKPRRHQHLDDMDHVSDDAHLEHLPRTGTPRHVSSLLRAHALYSPYHYEHSAAQPHLPPHSPMVQPRLHLCRSAELRGLPHTHSLRAPLHREISLGLLAHLPRLHSHHTSCSLASQQDSRMDQPTNIQDHQILRILNFRRGREFKRILKKTENHEKNRL